MNSRHPVLTVLTAGVLAALSAAAFAGSGTTTTESSKLASTYATFAGSEANAEALVDGLRNGTSITLETTTPPSSAGGTGIATTTTFQPATHKMGFGNVNIALALAQKELATQGITNPSAEEIEAALNGGTVTLTNGTKTTSLALQGVLALRAKGEGWGRVAHTLGFKLGDVVSVSKTDHSQAGVDHSQHGNDMAAANRPAHPDHPVHPDHPQRPNIPQRPDIPSHDGRPGH